MLDYLSITCLITDPLLYEKRFLWTSNSRFSIYSYFFNSWIINHWYSSRHITHQYKTWLTLRLGQQVPRPFIGHLNDTRGRLTGLALHVPPTPNTLSRLWPLIAWVRGVQAYARLLLCYQVHPRELHLYSNYYVTSRAGVFRSVN